MTATWVAVLSRCTGEPEVGTAVVDAGGQLRCATGRAAGSTWAVLADGLSDAALSGRPHSLVDVHGLAQAAAADLMIGLDAAAGHLRVDYDSARVSPIAASRVLGYVEYAMAHAVNAPDEQVDLAGMIGPDERHHQLHGLCGPRVNNGRDGFVPAFRARAAAQPHRPALHHRGRRLSYAELDRASDRIARHLHARGVAAGDRVAVISDRHPDWIVALLGVLKAGAVYLPVRPDFPPSRVEDQLTRAECRVALTDGSGAELMTAVAGLGSWSGAVLDIAGLHHTRVPADLCDTEEPAGGRYLAPPTLDTPAYVYFTSGSTGRPKGAVCAHDGMINHLWAKADDHGLGPDSVVAQTASQCFDISLWQVCAPLLVGGATVIVDTGTQLDVPAFAELLASHRVTTVQIVPSYLEVLLAHLETGAVRLPELTSVSVTGEALKASLVRRWFAVAPGVRLINAYGATEVSDDTMHEVLDTPPRRELTVVNVGRPLRNMRVYVVDEQQRLMPEGARGEIVFAGVCVGAGYLNDPERTAEAFLPDPYFPGERLYRSGDLGRWLPERRLEFLGRLDDQVKIRGLRVEIGEVQTALLRAPDISAAAVVPVGEGNSARLVGCYVSEYELASVDLHDLLSAWLPEYMVPAHYLRLAELPLNENGKTDKQQLTRLAEDLVTTGDAFEPPSTPQEHELATLWAEVLGLPAGRASRHDSFFELGGTSLSAIHLLMRLDHRLSLTDVLTCPVLKEQAALLETADPATVRPLLHQLNGPAAGRPTLICLPDAGGNAINLRPLAEVAGDRVQVLAVELPGHDLARPDEELAALSTLARRLAEEVPATWAPYLWGQGAGAVAALAVASALDRVGTAVAGVVIAWDDAVPRHAARDWPDRLTDEDVADRLSRRHAYVAVDGAAPGRLPLVARAYRHDWAEALRVLDELVGDAGRVCRVVELTLGSASTLLGADARGVSVRHLAGAADDVAWPRPEDVLDALDSWRALVGAPA